MGSGSDHWSDFCSTVVSGGDGSHSQRVVEVHQVVIELGDLDGRLRLHRTNGLFDREKKE